MTIQSSEDSIETKQTLIYTFLNLLKICHPFIFVTEELNSIYKKGQECCLKLANLVSNDAVQSESIMIS